MTLDRRSPERDLLETTSLVLLSFRANQEGEC
jgi:hypothetical protein